MQNKQKQNVAAVLCCVAHRQRQNGNFKIAASLYKRAVTQLERIPGDKSTPAASSSQVGLIYMDIAECLHSGGDSEGSQHALARAESIMREHGSIFLNTPDRTRELR